MADADLVVAQERKDSQSCPIGKCFEHGLHLINRGFCRLLPLLHIFALTNIPTINTFAQAYIWSTPTWTRSKSWFNTSTAPPRTWCAAAQRPTADAAPRAATRSRPIYTTSTRRLPFLLKLCWHRSGAATRPPSLTCVREKSCSTWDR